MSMRARAPTDERVDQRNLRVRLSMLRWTEAILTCERPPSAPAASIASWAARRVSHTASASPSRVVPRAPTSYRSPEPAMTAIAASTYACGLAGVPGGEGATWISAITHSPPRSVTTTPRRRSSSPSPAVLRSCVTSPVRSLLALLLGDRRRRPVLGALGQDGGPLRDPPGDVLLGEAGVGQHLTAAAVLEEPLRQAHGPDRDVDLAVLQRLGEGGADAAGPAAVLDGDDHAVPGGQVEQLVRDRQHPPRVDNGHLDAVVGGALGGGQAHRHHRADGDPAHRV